MSLKSLLRQPHKPTPTEPNTNHGIQNNILVGPVGFEPGTSYGCCALGLFGRPVGPHASVIFGSFSMTFLGACCCVRCLNVGSALTILNRKALKPGLSV